MLISVFGIWLMPFTILQLQQTDARTMGFLETPVKCEVIVANGAYNHPSIRHIFKGKTCDEVANEINSQITKNNKE